MSYVKSGDYVAKVEAMFRQPRFLYEGLRVAFQTTPAFIEEILPPGLEPGDAPDAYLSIGRWQSAVCGQFDTGSVFFKAQHEGTVGWYNLTMIVSGETPVVWGREVWGEVKKHGTAGVYRDGNLYHAYAERHGVRLMEIEAELDQVENDVVADTVALEVKACPSASGVGLEYDPRLLKLGCRSTFRKVVSGTGRLTLRGTPDDPVDTIPVEKILSVSYAEGETAYHHIGSSTLCPAQDYLPYFYGRHYDDYTRFPVAARYKG